MGPAFFQGLDYYGGSGGGGEVVITYYRNPVEERRLVRLFFLVGLMGFLFGAVVGVVVASAL